MQTGEKRFHYAWLILIGCCFMQAGGLGAILDAAGVFFVPVCERKRIVHQNVHSNRASLMTRDSPPVSAYKNKRKSAYAFFLLNNVKL